MTQVPQVTDKLPTEPERLREIAAERLAALTPKQREWAVAFARGGSVREAALAAGYSEHSAQDLGQRLGKHPDVMSAVHALTALRGAEATFEADDVCRLLEQALSVTAEDLVIRNSTGQAIGLRENLSPAEHLRVKRIQARVRRSAKGERSHIVSLDIELHSPLDIIDRLAKLRGWAPDSPFAVNIATLGEAHVSAPPPIDPLLAELADAVLSNAELRRFVAAEDAEKRELLRSAIERLRRLAA